MKTENLYQKVKTFSKTWQLFRSGDRLVAGISGGADSVCLLFVLKNLCEELGMELIAVHVNHGIRGEEAMEDQRFVENLCERLDVKIRICSGKVPELAKAEKLSEEEAGREKDLEAVHVQQLLELFERQSGRRIDLPYNLEAIRDYEGVKIRKKLWNKSIYSENTGLKKMEREGGKQKNQEATKSDGDKKKGNCILQIPGRTAFPGAKAEIICKIIEKNKQW